MTACLAMVFLDQTVVAVALPSIRQDLGISKTEFQLVVNAYLLALASLAVAAGRLSDLIGHARGAALGVGIFATGSLLCGAAQSPVWLIAARAVQGVGAALLLSSTQAVVSSAFAEERRGRAIGIYIGVAGLALSLGPLLGGVLTGALSWRWIFWINPLIALAIVPVLAELVRAEGPARSVRGLDPIGVALFALSLVALILGLRGFAALPLVGAAVLFALFALHERGRLEPLLDARLLRQRAVLSSLLVLFLTQFVVVWGAVFFGTYLQTVLHFPAVKAGSALLPVTFTLLAGAVLGGRLTDVRGARMPGVVGLVGVVLALVWLGAIVTQEDYGLLVPGFLVLGLALATAQTPMQTALMNAVPDDRRAGATGLQATFRQLGALVGVAALGGVVFRTEAGGFADGMQVALYLAAAITTVALVVLLTVMPARAAAPDPRLSPPQAPRSPAGAPDQPPSRL